jgi:hypothetical protein
LTSNGALTAHLAASAPNRSPTASGPLEFTTTGADEHDVTTLSWADPTMQNRHEEVEGVVMIQLDRMGVIIHVESPAGEIQVRQFFVSRTTDPEYIRNCLWTPAGEAEW